MIQYARAILFPPSLARVVQIDKQTFQLGLVKFYKQMVE